MVTMQDDIDSNDNTFPDAMLSLKNKMVTLLNVAKNKMPNLKQVHLMSRSYTGWCDPVAMAAHAEPAAYHNGFTNKMLTVDCINGVFGNAIWINDGCYFWY